jgi:endonuclease/exonuclease/phosphatase family metal-dependent hydrolase
MHTLLLLQVQQLLQEVGHMQDRHMQLQQQQQPPNAARSSNGASASAAVEPAAVLLCGDFNTTPDSDTVQVCEAELAFASLLCPPVVSMLSVIAVVLVLVLVLVLQ